LFDSIDQNAGTGNSLLSKGAKGSRVSKSRELSGVNAAIEGRD